MLSSAGNRALRGISSRMSRRSGVTGVGGSCANGAMEARLGFPIESGIEGVNDVLLSVGRRFAGFPWERPPPSEDRQTR